MLFIMHADHEQNCSTSTVRLVGSSPGQPVHLHLGGISALQSLHGGANRQCWRCSRRSNGRRHQGLHGQGQNKEDGGS